MMHGVGMARPLSLSEFEAFVDYKAIKLEALVA